MKHPVTMADVMTHCPQSLAASSSLEEARNKLSFSGIRHLPVTDGGEVIGILTERDLSIANAVCERLGECPASLAEIGLTEPLIVLDSDEVSSVSLQMVKRREHCALVSDKEGNFVGIFTSSDACKLLHLVLEESRLS